MSNRPLLSIGIEEEYQLIDPESRQLSPSIDQVLASCNSLANSTHTSSKIKSELHTSMIEACTPICNSISELYDALHSQRTFIKNAAHHTGLDILAASTHPFSNWYDQLVTPSQRYLELKEELQMLAHQTVVYGMHIHIGINDRDDAIHIMNAIQSILPHLLALSTSSPFWMGFDSGLKSYRTHLLEGFVRTGIPNIFHSANEYDTLISTLINTRCISDPSKVWWDLRLHHSYPTLEVRVCDICTSIDDAIALAAFVQVAALYFYKHNPHTLSPFYTPLQCELIKQNKWRAARYGLNTNVVDIETMSEVPFRQSILKWLHNFAEEIDELNLQKSIEPLNDIIMRGTSADRQLFVYKLSGNSFTHVIDDLISQSIVAYKPELDFGKK